jgi:hypothetical protein
MDVDPGARRGRDRAPNRPALPPRARVAHPRHGLDPAASDPSRLERDEDRITRWVAEDWPRIKQTPTSRAVWLVFADEAGINLMPHRCAGPGAHAARCRSCATAIGAGSRSPWSGSWPTGPTRPDGSKTRLLFRFERGVYDTDRLTRVLDRLEGFLGGQPVTLIWTTSPSTAARPCTPTSPPATGWRKSSCRRTGQNSTGRGRVGQSEGR